MADNPNCHPPTLDDTYKDRLQDIENIVNAEIDRDSPEDDLLALTESRSWVVEKYNILVAQDRSYVEGLLKRIMRQDADVYMRYSINAFNTEAQLDTLYKALEEIKKEGKLL